MITVVMVLFAYGLGFVVMLVMDQETDVARSAGVLLALVFLASVVDGRQKQKERKVKTWRFLSRKP